MFVYILHFDTPLHHAQHYVGSTNNVKQRLTTHARAAGAKITQALVKEGSSWHVGALLQCTQKTARVIEKDLKAQKNAHRYCSICTSEPKQFKPAKRYPVENLPFPTSSNLFTFDTLPHLPILINEGRHENDLEYVVREMHKEKEALGFLPKLGVRKALECSEMIVARLEEEKVGYVLFTVNRMQDTIRIHQCYVEDKHRCKGLGQAMIEFLQHSRPTSSVACKVRQDLTATLFWETIGFTLIRTTKHKTSGKNLCNFFKPPLLSLGRHAFFKQPELLPEKNKDDLQN